MVSHSEIGRNAEGGQVGPRSRLHAQLVEECALEPEFDRFATLAATVCETPIAAVTLIDGGYQWVKAAKGLKQHKVAAERSFCAHTVRAGALTEIADATRDDRVKDNEFVTGSDHVRFYAGVPLTDSTGASVGALCVLDTMPRPEGLSGEQRRALILLAGQASLQLKLQQALAERDRTAAELRWAASHDFLTGLGNRAFLREALSDLERSGAPMALLAIDVDHFKRVNDSFGHQAGDELLTQVARRLSASVRAKDIVVRVGGDEFAVVVRDIACSDEVDDLAARLLRAMREPVLHDGRSIDCRVTIGGAQHPRDAASANDLLGQADAALGEAKSRGRGRYVAFEPGMLSERSRHLAQITLAQQALTANSIIPYYQPKVDLADGTTRGVEALLRVVEADGTVRLPHEIGAAFGEGELAQAIGNQMLGQVLRDMQRWTARGIDFGRVAVNLSATEIGDPTFASRLLAALTQHDIRPEQFEIEIIEDVLLDERAGAVLATVHSLSQAGVSVAFDDFGTGYAALSHLPNFAVNVLKIDRSFVRNLNLRANRAIIAAMLSMARDLAMEVVAEGVETVAQAAELRRLGCRLGQGFLYCEPLPADQVADVLRGTRIRRRRCPRPNDRLPVTARAA